MKKNINKIISIIILISIVVSNLPLGEISAYVVKPSVAISSPSKTSVSLGESVSYTVIYSDAENINLSSSYVTLNGFNANISVSGSGNTRKITLSNIQGNLGNKSIAIKSKSAENDAGYSLATPNSISFNLKNNNTSSAVDKIRPSISVSSPSKTSVNVGGSLSYTITFTDNIGIKHINTTASFITLNGFTANISVSNSSNKSVVTLSNIKGTAGKKSISIKAGAAKDSAGNSTAAIVSTTSFNLINNVTNNQNNINKVYTDKVRPSVSISTPNSSTIYKGGNITYTVSFADNRGISKLSLLPSFIILNGFSANISISGSGNTRMITLSNVRGTTGKKSIAIKAGAAIDSAGNSTLATPNSVSFNLIENKNTTSVTNKPTKQNVSSNKSNTTLNKGTSINKNTNITNITNIANIQASTVLKKSIPTITSTCNDNLVALGDVNKEIKNFSTWLSSEKIGTTYSIQNNYVAKDEEITYFVDYYNGKEDVVKDIKIKLIIPYNVDVLEINSNGYIKEQSEKETIIEWDKNTLQSLAKCRLAVKVKYLQNAVLETSNNISEEFYVTLETKSDSLNETSYLKQLYIDKSDNKKGTETKYLYSINNNETLRPDDKITRAELAKLIVDSKIVEVKQGNVDYKKYKDANEIPSYATAAVGTLYNSGIMKGFVDSEFKPNNPIVRDEFFNIIAKASEYMSNGKLKVKEPTFIYTDIVNDDDKTLSENTKYIMELIRQNIIAKEDTEPDEYILRKDAIQIINALMFRGPYTGNLKVKAVKFIDVKEDNKYFYDIVGASNTYTYNYSEKLEQQIVEIK